MPVLPRKPASRNQPPVVSDHRVAAFEGGLGFDLDDEILQRGEAKRLHQNRHVVQLAEFGGVVFLGVAGHEDDF